MSEQNGTPQPRYSKEHREQAVRENRPLFTLDIYYPKGTKSPHGLKRSTITGVLSEEELKDAARMLGRQIQKQIEDSAPPSTTEKGGES